VDIQSAAQEIEALIHEYGKLVFHTIYGLTGNWEESQDLTQDTFQQALKAFNAAKAASGPHFHAKAWLLRIALNTVRMQRRRRKIFQFIPFSHVHSKREQESKAEQLTRLALPAQPAGYGARADEDPAELIAEQDAVRRTLAKLPEAMRLCLLLAIVGGLSNAEIAQTLDIQEPAVRQRIARARKQFQQIYEYESGNHLVAPPNTHATTNQPWSEQAEQSNQSSEQQHLKLTTPPPTARRRYV
jgi:RNA polymerase sigma-70 factor, ECF subfamily